MTQDFDEAMWMQGDEDGGVGLQCRVCDRGGLPIAYYTSDLNNKTYVDADVVLVRTMTDFVKAGVEHLKKENPVDLIQFMARHSPVTPKRMRVVKSPRRKNMG